MADINLIRKRYASKKIDPAISEKMFEEGLEIDSATQNRGKQWLTKNRKRVFSAGRLDEDAITESIPKITEIKFAGVVSQGDIQNNISALGGSRAFNFYLPIYRVYTSDPNVKSFDYTLAFPDKNSQRYGIKQSSGVIVYVM